MAPKLYGIYGSPPFGAVLMCAKTLGIDLDVQLVNLLTGEHLKEDFVQKNPQHTVPLLDDDGFILADSHAINGYLVGTYGKPNDPLYPKNDVKRRATIDHRLHLDSSIVAARAFLISKPLVLNDVQPRQETLDYLREAFAILDKQIEVQNSHYIVGNQFSIADFSITATVTTWGIFVNDWEKDFVNIKGYINRMKQEEWFEVNVKGVEAFSRLANSKLQSE